MGVVKRIQKTKTHRGKRALEKREPKIDENCKKALFLRGTNASQKVIECIRDMVALKKPNATFFSRKHESRPFEDEVFLQNITKKYDMSMFGFGSHNKKRPHNLTIGRMFNHQLLDMIELGIEEFHALKEFKVTKVTAGSKPMLLFSGEAFHTEIDYQRVKNLLIDFFRGPIVEAVRLGGMEHVLQFVALDGRIYMRSFKLLMKKSGLPNPRVELEEIGPRIDFVLRRTKFASDDLMKTACKQPPQAKPKKVKNVSKNVFGSKLGRLHMQKQDLGKLQHRKIKGLKKAAAKNKSRRNIKQPSKQT